MKIAVFFYISINILSGASLFYADAASAQSINAAPSINAGQSVNASQNLDAAQSINASQDSKLAQNANAKFVQLFNQSSQCKETYAKVLAAIDALPASLRQEMQSSGLHIVVVPSLVEYRPELEGKIPNGYKPGRSFSHMDAQYRGKQNEIVVAATVARKSEDLIPNIRAGSATLHEFGHAYDHYANFPSRSDDFMSRYRQDCAALTQAQKDKDYYYLQEGRNGPKELFAELFLFCFHEKAHLHVRHGNLVTDFPNCYAFVAALTDKLK